MFLSTKKSIFIHKMFMLYLFSTVLLLRLCHRLFRLHSDFPKGHVNYNEVHFSKKTQHR